MPKFIPIQLHPALFYTIALICGIILSLNKIFLVLIFSVIILLAICILAALKKISLNKLFWILSINICFILGYSRTSYIAYKYNNILKLLENKPITYTGWVSKIEKTSNSYFKKRITLNLVSAKINNIKIKTNYLIKISLPETTNINSGVYLKFLNLIIKSPDTKFQNILIKENILSNIYLQKPNFKILNFKRKSIWPYIAQYRENLLNRLSKKLNNLTLTLFQYIFLGLKIENSSINPIKLHMNYWGITHYLARSGIHAAFIVLILTIVLRFIPISFKIKQNIMFFFSLIYSALTWTSTSFERALLTFVFYRFCNLKNLPINSLYILILTCFSMLLYNPFALFSLDFQLSFSLTFALSILNELSIRALNLSSKNY